MEKKKRKKSTFFSDFKAFITKGNVMDMAVGVVIGTAFSAIVNSLVKDIIMPLLNLATGNGVEGLSVVLNGVPKYLEDGAINPEAILWNYGNFLQSIINFLIIALCIFTTLRIIMNIKKASEKIAEKAKQSLESKTQQSQSETVAQEAVADVAPTAEVETQAPLAQESQPQEEAKLQSDVAQESAVEEVQAEEILKEVEPKESQEDILKQIRDLLMAMKSEEKKAAPRPSVKKATATKTSAKKD